MAYTLVADIGGTKLATALFNELGQIEEKIVYPTSTGSAEALFQQLMETFDYLIQSKGLTKEVVANITVGVPGIVENGLALYQNNIPWRNFPVENRVKENYPSSNVYCINDVAMAAYGEWSHYLNSNGVFIFLTISTGISCCTIIDKQIVKGQGFAGELGFQKNSDENKTFEKLFAGPALEAEMQMSLKDIDDIMELSNLADIIESFIDNIAKQLYTMQLLLDPNYIVLGGGLLNNQAKLMEKVIDRVQRYKKATIFENRANILRKAFYGGDAGLYGGYYIGEYNAK